MNGEGLPIQQRGLCKCDTRWRRGDKREKKRRARAPVAQLYPCLLFVLAVSLNVDDVDTNRELVAHGVSNVLAGLLGTVPNYLVYVNTLM